jgi:hypothetical protein
MQPTRGCQSLVDRHRGYEPPAKAAAPARGAISAAAITGADGMVEDHRRQTACGHHVAPAQKVEDLAELGV